MEQPRNENEEHLKHADDGSDEDVPMDEEEEDGIEYVVEEGIEEEEASENIEDSDQRQDDSQVSFEGHTDSVYCVDLWTLPQKVTVTTPENTTMDIQTIVATGGGDDKAFIWNASNGAKLFELLGHKDTVSSIRFNHDGSLLATGSYDGTVKVWESNTGKLVQSLEGPGEGIEWLCWHQKGNVVLAGSGDGTSWMWLSNGTCMNVFGGHSGPVTCGMFTLDGKNIVTGSDDATMKVWDPKTATPLTTFQGHGFHTEGLVCLASSLQNPSLVISGAQDASVVLSNIHTNKIIGNLSGHTDSVEAVGICSSMPFAATASLDKNLLIWDLNTLQQRGACPHDDGVIKMSWHPLQPALLFTGSLDKSVRLWDSRTGVCQKVWKGHTNAILDFAVTKDGSALVSTSDDQAALVFKV